MKINPSVYMRFILFLPVFFLFSCISYLKQEETPHVTLGYNEIAYRYAILLKDEELPHRFKKPTRMPYSDNARGMIWIGKFFPHEQAIDLILSARNYYKELKYVAFFDINPRIIPDKRNFELYIGAPTEDALKINLKAWDDKDFSALEKIKSEDDYRHMIVSRYPADIKIEKKSFFTRFLNEWNIIFKKN